jgi:hypothetical protein
MGFFTSWDPSGHVTLMCFDVPAVSQSTIYTTLCSQAVDPSLPYSSFTHILDELLRLYDNSAWSVRNHISRWEAVSHTWKHLAANDISAYAKTEEDAGNRLRSLARDRKTRRACQRDVECGDTIA